LLRFLCLIWKSYSSLEIVKVEHVKVTSKLLKWILEVDQVGERKWIIEK
jgi:hypothetical protein